LKLSITDRKQRESIDASKYGMEGTKQWLKLPKKFSYCVGKSKVDEIQYDMTSAMKVKHQWSTELSM
jgi:hypothetical protein